MAATAKKKPMDRMMDWMTEHIMPIAGKIGEQKHIVSITRGVMASIPLTIIGGISLILAYPPVDAATLEATNFFTRFLLAWANWAAEHNEILNLPNEVTIGLLGLYICIGVAYHLSQQYKMDSIGVIITSLMSFIVACAPPHALEGQRHMWMYTRFMGSRGIFAGILIAIAVVELTRLMLGKGFKINLPDSVPPMVTKPFEALVPGIVCVVLFMGMDAALMAAFEMNLPEAIMMMFSPFARAVDSVAGMAGIQFLINFLWFFGIYGSAAPDAVTSGFFMENIALNSAAYQAGEALPAIATTPFRTCFGNIGGCGSAFALAICILIFARSTQLRTIGKIGFIPSIFGIAEPLTFGVPLVFNPMMLFPMIMSSTLNTIITFLLMQWNVIGRIFVNVPWTTPKILDAFLATMDIKASLLVICLVIMDIFIYMPFIKVYDKSLLEKEKGEVAVTESK